jgi:transposase-like protein
MRINHREQFADRGNHINGIENFWNQAKRHLRRYNGIPRAHFPPLPQGMRMALQLPPRRPLARNLENQA